MKQKDKNEVRRLIEGLLDMKFPNKHGEKIDIIYYDYPSGSFRITYDQIIRLILDHLNLRVENVEQYYKLSKKEKK